MFMSGVDHEYSIAQAVECRVRQRARRIGREAQIIRRSRHPFALRELSKIPVLEDLYALHDGGVYPEH